MYLEDFVRTVSSSETEHTSCLASHASNASTCSEWMYPRFPARWIQRFRGDAEAAKLLEMLSFGGEESEPIIRVAAANTQWGAHFDEQHNHLVQLFGRKRVVLFPRYAADALRLEKHRHTSVHALEDPSVQHVPALQVILEAGDVLFIPSMMIHFTEALASDRGTLNVALNQFSGVAHG